jgi:hypothetical protein
MSMIGNLISFTSNGVQVVCHFKKGKLELAEWPSSQVVEYLLSKHEALSSILSTTTTTKINK